VGLCYAAFRLTPVTSSGQRAGACPGYCRSSAPSPAAKRRSAFWWKRRSRYRRGPWRASSSNHCGGLFQGAETARRLRGRFTCGFAAAKLHYACHSASRGGRHSPALPACALTRFASAPLAAHLPATSLAPRLLRLPDGAFKHLLQSRTRDYLRHLGFCRPYRTATAAVIFLLSQRTRSPLSFLPCLTSIAFLPATHASRLVACMPIACG